MHNKKKEKKNIKKNKLHILVNPSHTDESWAG